MILHRLTAFIESGIFSPRFPLAAGPRPDIVMLEYTILERGRRDNGGSWARYIYGPDNTECTIETAPGLKAENAIASTLEDIERGEEYLNSLTPEERAKQNEVMDRAMRRWSIPG